MTKLNHLVENGKLNADKKENNSLTINELSTKNLPVPFGAERLKIPFFIYKGNEKVPTIKQLKPTKQITLGDFFNQLPNLNKVEADNLKSAYLTFKETGDKKPYDALKTQLNAVIFYEFSTRQDANCVNYYGLLGMDIDGYDDPFEMLLDLSHLKTNPYVFMAFPSPSGHGLRILIWTDAIFETHKLTYKSLLSYLSDWLHVTTDKKKNPHLDPSTSNPSRLWFFTATTDIYLNLDSQVFTPSVFETTDNKVTPQTPIKKPHNTGNTLTDTDKMEACIEIAKRRNINDGDTNPYIHSVACIAIEHGVSTDAVLSYFSNLYAYRNFDKQEFYNKIQKPIDSAARRTHQKFEDGQLLKYLKNDTPSVSTPIPKAAMPTSVPKAQKAIETTNSDTFESDKSGAMNEMEEYISERYELRYNYILNEFEISIIGKNRFTILNQNDLIRELQSNKIKASDKSLKVSLLSSFVPRYNPIQAEFLSLKNKWKQGDEDHIAQFSSYIETTDQYFFNLHFKKMLVRVVACALGYISFNKHCFTLYSTQNDGKTSLFRALCPEVLKPYYKENLDIDKDGRLALCQNLFINLDELRGLSKADINEIKTYFSLETVKDRPPYGDKPLIFRRTASFFASTNNRDFLTDETGNVRWLVFEVKKINHDRGGKNGYMSVDITAMWAQAVYLLDNGFEYQLSADEIAYSETNNKVNYSKTTYEMELIQEYFDAGTEQEHDCLFTAAKIQDEISIGTNRKINYYQIGRALTGLGYPCVRKYDKEKRNTGTFYYLKRREN